MPNSIAADEIRLSGVETSTVFNNAIKTPMENIDALINAHLTASLRDLYMKIDNKITAINAAGKKIFSNNPAAVRAIITASSSTSSFFMLPFVPKSDFFL